MADDKEKKDAANKPPGEVPSYKPGTGMQTPLPSVNSSSAHTSDEAPSLIRRANEAFLTHQKERKGNKRDPQSYRPRYKQSDNTQPKSRAPDDHFDDLIGEFMRQQSNVRVKKKGMFAIKTDNATKVRVLFLVGVLLLVARFRAEQDDNDATFSRLEASQAGLERGDVHAPGSARRKLFSELGTANNLSDAVLRSGREHGGGGMSLSAKSAAIPVLAEKQRNELKLSAWRDLMICASQSVWSGYHSAGFSRVNDDLLVYSAGDAVYAFTPYFSGGQRVFEGWFWHRSLGKLASVLGKDLTHTYPTADFVLPYTHRHGRRANNQTPGAFYIKIRRGGAIVGSPIYRMGRPLTSTGHRELQALKEQAVMWMADAKHLREESAEILLSEVEAQLARFLANESRPWPLVSYSRNTETAWNVHVDRVLQSCQRSAELFKSEALASAASEQRQRLRKDPNALWYPTLLVHKVNLDGEVAMPPYWYPPRYTSQELRDCLLHKRVPSGQAFWATVGMNSRGQPGSLRLQPTGEHTPAIDSCYRRALRKMTFPPAKKNLRYVSLLYRFQ